MRIDKIYHHSGFVLRGCNVLHCRKLNPLLLTYQRLCLAFFTCWGFPHICDRCYIPKKQVHGVFVRKAPQPEGAAVKNFV